MAQKSFPSKAFEFTAPVSVEGGEELQSRYFSGVAYSGDAITDHGYFGAPIVFDLASTTVATPAPLLSGHDHAASIGVIDHASISDAIHISGTLFSNLDAEAKAIAAKADAGFPWQMSVGIYPGSVQEVKSGDSIELNGREFTGPINVFRDSRVREVSFVALGADPQTSARVFGSGDTIDVEVIMSEPNEPVEPVEEEVIVDPVEEEIVEILEEQAGDADEVVELRAQLKQAREELAAFKTAQRMEKVQALFSAMGREAGDVSPYLTMTDAQFSAVSNDLMATKPDVPEYLFGAVARSGAEDERPSLASINQRVLKQFQGK